jgi:hypothetical protein
MARLINRGTIERGLGQVFPPCLQVGFRARRNAKVRVLKIGFDRGTYQAHSLFGGSQIAFFKVAGLAGNHNIGPVAFSASGFRHHMIDRQREIGYAAVLASEVIAPQNVLFAESDDLFSVSPNQLENTNDGWKPEGNRRGAYLVAVAFDFLGPARNYHDQTAFGTAKLQRLIGIIQNQDFQRIKHRLAVPSVALTQNRELFKASSRKFLKLYSLPKPAVNIYPALLDQWFQMKT